MPDPEKKRSLPSWAPTASTPPTPVTDQPGPTQDAFSKLLDGVVFALSGFVNPERAALRAEAVEMGAEYRPDWGPDCTLLVCAYGNTPKFRLVQSQCGTVVSKDWIHRCHSARRLVDIDSFLMFAGKPWRRTTPHDQKQLAAGGSAEQGEGGMDQSGAGSLSVKNEASASVYDRLSPSKVKEWAVDDVCRTIEWLESQEEKPEASEIEQIAAEGVLLCLQDAIDSLERNQDIHQIVEQWNIVPHAVQDLVKLVNGGADAASIRGEDILRRAKEYKQMYDDELGGFSSQKEKKQKTNRIEKNGGEGRTNANFDDAAVGYDSDETIEMTEEEIDTAYNSITSKLGASQPTDN